MSKSHFQNTLSKLTQLAIIGLFANQVSAYQEKTDKTYLKNLNTLIASKPDVTVNFHPGHRTHFWVIVPKIDPNTFNPSDYADISAYIKFLGGIRYVEDMNQFRSCKEHAKVNDELFYPYKNGRVYLPLDTREKEIEISKTNCSVVLVHRSIKTRASLLHHHLDRTTCNGLRNYCGTGGSCFRRNRMAVLPADITTHKDYLWKRKDFDSELKRDYGNLKGDWRTTGHWSHVRSIVVRDTKDHWLRILEKRKKIANRKVNGVTRRHKVSVSVIDYHSHQTEFAKKYNRTSRSALYEVADRMGFKDKCHCLTGFSGPRCTVKGGTTETPITMIPTTPEATTSQDATTPFAATTITTDEVITINSDTTIIIYYSNHTSKSESSDIPKKTHPTTIFWWLILVIAIACLCFFGIYTFLKHRRTQKSAPNWNELMLNEES